MSTKSETLRAANNPGFTSLGVSRTITSNSFGRPSIRFRSSVSEKPNPLRESLAIKSKRSVCISKFSSVTELCRKSAMFSLAFSYPTRKVRLARGSRSMSSVFFPYSVNATESACAKVDLPEPPAVFARQIIDLLIHSPTDSANASCPHEKSAEQ